MSTLSPRDARRQLVARGWRRHQARALIRWAQRNDVDLHHLVADYQYWFVPDREPRFGKRRR